MKEVIERMLATEEEARKILSDAEREADRIMAASRGNAAHIEETARRQAQEEASRLVAQGEKETRQQHAQQLAQAHLDAEKSAESATSRDEAVDLVVHALLGDDN